MKYETIEEAFFYVSSAPPFERSAVVHRVTGESFYASDMAGHDEIPDEAETDDDYIQIPHKNDLDLGKALVTEFVQIHCPDLYDEVSAIFRRKGAYGRYKDLLDQNDLLEKWYAYEEEKSRETLLQWCNENGIELE